MKIDELIQKLTGWKERAGNLDVCIFDGCNTWMVIGLKYKKDEILGEKVDEYILLRHNE